MNAVLGMLAALLLLSATPAPAQSLDDAAVDAAVKAGRSGTFSQLVFRCSVSPGLFRSWPIAGPLGSFSVVASRAAGRIASTAANAKKLEKPFSASDVTPEMRDDSILFVSVTPDWPWEYWDSVIYPSQIRHVVLKSKRQPDAVVQPVTSNSQPVEFSGLEHRFGRWFHEHFNSMCVTFPLEAVRSMPAGEIEVVVITQAERYRGREEIRCEMSTGDRSRILK